VFFAENHVLFAQGLFNQESRPGTWPGHSGSAFATENSWHHTTVSVRLVRKEKCA